MGRRSAVDALAHVLCASAVRRIVRGWRSRPGGRGWGGSATPHLAGPLTFRHLAVVWGSRSGPQNSHHLCERLCAPRGVFELPRLGRWLVAVRFGDGPPPSPSPFQSSVRRHAGAVVSMRACACRARYSTSRVSAGGPSLFEPVGRRAAFRPWPAPLAGAAGPPRCATGVLRHVRSPGRRPTSAPSRAGGPLIGSGE